jgi:hypothetical protein
MVYGHNEVALELVPFWTGDEGQSIALMTAALRGFVDVARALIAA